MQKKLMMQLNIKDGVNKVQIDEDMFEHIRGFEVVRLPAEKKAVFQSDNYEIGLVILKGKCSINIDGTSYADLGARVDVFDGAPTAVYIPREQEFSVISQDVELALCYSRCEQKKKPAVITPDAIKPMQVGKDNWRRQVSLIISPDSYSQNLIVGETINPAGNWSGTPAHKHEVDNPPTESLHEELYYFRCDKENGFGLQRLYSPEKGINELLYLKKDTVTFMPWGYHQIVAGPGYTLYYLFFLAGKGKLIGFPDPEHKWLND